MSDAISSSYSAGYGLLGRLVSDSSQVKSRLDTLTEQAATGQVSQSLSGLGSGTKLSLDLHAEMTHQQAWMDGISAADTSISVSQTAMNQISSVASDFYSQLNNLNGLDASSVDNLAASAREALKQVAGLLDTQNGDSYVFAGTDSGNPPVPNPDDILNSGFYQQINAAVSGLATNGASATAASTLAVAGSNAAGTSPFSAALSQPAATLAAQRTSVQVGAGQRVPVGLLASGNVAATSSGDSTTGSYMRDLMRSLATIGSLSSSQAAAAGFQDLVSDTRSSLKGAISAMGDEEGDLGNTQSRIDAASSVLSDTKTALTTQVSNIEDVDMASVATSLSLVQTQLQASYQMISNVSGLSLVAYLS